MADKKFLDQSGVTTLWKKIKNNIEAVKTADEARIKALEDNDKYYCFIDNYWSTY